MHCNGVNAIKALDVNSHMHLDHVASFGGRTGLLYPEQIRKLLARFAITFSDGYFNLLTSLMDTEPNGEVRKLFSRSPDEFSVFRCS